jgi:mRNA interferase RelE/StbE
LRGPLAGYYRIPFSRYRAIYTVQESGQSVAVVVLFVAAGARKQGDKKDIYRLAEKLMELGMIAPSPKRGNK